MATGGSSTYGLVDAAAASASAAPSLCASASSKLRRKPGKTHGQDERGVKNENAQLAPIASLTSHTRSLTYSLTHFDSAGTGAGEGDGPSSSRSSLLPSLWRRTYQDHHMLC